jgi:asparagine synthase (glutamine-hydrolysing)
MCGICGVVYSNPAKPVSRELLTDMTEILIHRGPDSHGMHIGPGVGLGVRRLSIIDLKNGDQPISNEDGSVTVICNGEIYNFKELQRHLLSRGHTFQTGSDVEVIVHLYEEYGPDCVNQLRGMFAFALWDSRCRQLMVARDRLGIKPLFYAQQDDGLLFASELKSILMNGRVLREINLHALDQLFTFGFVLAPYTLLNNINRLLPGHYLIYKDGNLSFHQYWDLHFPTSRDYTDKTTEEWASLLKAKLRETVDIHLRSDVPVGALLSAGLDSSAIVSLMSRNNHSVQTFSLTFENRKYDEFHTQKTLKDFPDFHISNQQILCGSADFELLSKAVWHCEDPFTTGLEIPQMILSKSASENVKVVLTGEGSDEIFGGYSWFRTDKLVKPLTILPIGLRKFVCDIPAVQKKWRIASRLLPALPELNLDRYQRCIGSSIPNFDFHTFSPEVFASMGNQKTEAKQFLNLPDEFYTWHRFAQLQYFEIKVRLPNYVTRHLDSASMAYSLETRVPFLDHELVEFSAQIPPSLKMKGIKEKYILRRAMREDLPKEIVNRKKRGLAAPFQQWVKNLPDFASDMLSEKSIREKGWFDPANVGRMIHQHRTGEVNYGKQLMGVLGVQIWDDLFLRGCKPSK